MPALFCCGRRILGNIVLSSNSDAEKQDLEWLNERFDSSEVDFILSLGIGTDVGEPFTNRGGMELCQSLHGREAQDPDHQQFMAMSSRDVYNHRYIAISYKHMHWIEEQRDGNEFRYPKMPRKEAEDVVKTKQDMQYPHYWHDGSKPRWRGEVTSCARGLYPYLLDGGKVVVVPPTCTREHIPDPSSWTPQEYPHAAKAFAECVRYCFYEDALGNSILVRRKVPGVPSVAFGSMMRVWLLAESFCGCLHGRIQFTLDGKKRMEAYIREIRTVHHMVRSFFVDGFNREHLRVGSKIEKWETPWIDRTLQLQELEDLLRDAVTYYMMVTNPSATRSPLDLSTFFLERMAFAGATYDSDRVVVGSMCAMMLQQVFGRHLAIDSAINLYEEADDPLSFAVMVASSGHHSVPLGVTTQQCRASIRAIRERAIGSYYNVERFKTMLSQFPQPMPGRCYAGTLTCSPWKYIFWHALCFNRGLGMEHDAEKEKAEKVKNSYMYRSMERKTQKAREDYFHKRWFLGQLNSRVGKSPSDELMWDPTHPLARVYTPLPEHDSLERLFLRKDEKGNNKVHLLNRRFKGLVQVIQAWTESQKTLIPLIGYAMPIIVDQEANIVSLYVLDAKELEGHDRGRLEKTKQPVVISNVAEFGVTVHDTYQTVKFDDAPLFQIVLSIPVHKSENGYLIAMRPVKDLAAAGDMPVRPTDLRAQKQKKQWSEVKELLKPKGFDRDWILPVRLLRTRLADYTQMKEYTAWHVPEFISKYHEAGNCVEHNPLLWKETWEKVSAALRTTWDEELGTWKINLSPPASTATPTAVAAAMLPTIPGREIFDPEEMGREADFQDEDITMMVHDESGATAVAETGSLMDDSLYHDDTSNDHVKKIDNQDDSVLAEELAVLNSTQASMENSGDVSSQHHLEHFSSPSTRSASRHHHKSSKKRGTSSSHRRQRSSRKQKSAAVSAVVSQHSDHTAVMGSPRHHGQHSSATNLFDEDQQQHYKNHASDDDDGFMKQNAHLLSPGSNSQGQ